MALIRRNQDGDIGKLVAGAERLAEWRRRIRVCFFWTPLAAASTIWMVTNWPRKVQMTKTDRSIFINDEPGTERAPTDVADQFTTCPSVYTKIRSFLIKVAIRAAQNYAAYCLDDWIAPTLAPGVNKTYPAPGKNAWTSRCRNPRSERIDEGCDGPGSVLLVASAK